MSNNSKTVDELELLFRAESRIDVAMSKLILATQGFTDAANAQTDALTELREARNAIRVLRDRVEREDPKPAL